MMYDLKCKCGEITEFWMSMKGNPEVECPKCDQKMTRHDNLVFTVPMVTGVNVPGNKTTLGKYDEMLGATPRSDAHRNELMEEKGLEMYAPDPTMKKHRDEILRISKSSLPNDPDAKAAIQKECKTATDKRRDRNVANSMAESYKKIGI